jgi:hypothetical protein
MYELEHVNDSLAIRRLGCTHSPDPSEWTAAPLMAGLEKLFREIGAYLEFVAIARGR